MVTGVSDVTSHTVRTDAVLLCVKPGGGAWRDGANAQRIAAGALLAEAALRGVVAVDGSRLAPGSTTGDGALALLAKEVANEPKHRRISHWIPRVESWALEAVVEELASSGLAHLIRTRLAGVLPQNGLEILDPNAQEEAARSVRDAVAGTDSSQDAALVALLLGAAGDLKYHVPGAAWPLLSFWNTRPRRRVRRRLRHLRGELPEGPRSVIRAYDKFWEAAHRYDQSG
jgi:hypothetical protein